MFNPCLPEANIRQGWCQLIKRYWVLHFLDTLLKRYPFQKVRENVNRPITELVVPAPRMQRPGIKRFPILENFARYPLYVTPCPLQSCDEQFKLPHDDTLKLVTEAADIMGRQCEMHLLFHKAMGHLGDTPARPLPPSVNVIESTAPIPPPRLDELGVALAPIPPTVTPPPPASSCPGSEQSNPVETQN